MEIHSDRSDRELPGNGRADELDRMLANASRLFQPVAPQAPPAAPTAAPGWSPADGWNLKLGQSAQNVLRHQLIEASPDVVFSLRAELADDFGRSQEQQVQLSPVVESLVRAALGSGEEAAASAPSGLSNGNALGGELPGSSGLSGSFNNGNALAGELQGSSGLSGSSLTPDPVSGPGDLQGWGQGAEGNCAAVAVIKAATDAYGDQVFQSMAPLPDGGYRITMQDGVTVEVSGQELSMAAQASNFNGSGPQMQQAQIAYAAMAKRALMEGHEGSTTYAQSLNSLANGDNPYDSARFLGLGNKVVNVDPRSLSGQDSVVGWNSTHAVFVDNRSTTDSYGSARGFDGTDTRGNALTNAFTFAPAASSATNTQPASRPAAGNPQSTRNVYHRHFNHHMSSGSKTR